MGRKLSIILVGIGFVLAFLLVQYQILVKGIGLSSIMISLAALSPFLVAVVIASQTFWVGIVLGLLNINVTIPLPVLNRLTPGLLFALIIAAIGLARWLATQRQRTLFRSAGARCLLLASALVAVRVIVSRPGTAQLGETGGAGEAIFYLAGALSFVALSTAASGNWRPGSNLRIACWLSLIGLAAGMVKAGIGGGWMAIAASVFIPPMWWLLPALLALLHERWPHRLPVAAWLSYLAVLGAGLAVSILTPFRSRPYFALAMIVLVAVVYRRMRQTVAALSVLAVIGGGVLLAVGTDIIPAMSRRALSTIIRVEQADAAELLDTYKMSGEFGWQSDFRATLNRIAWKNIKERPLAGKGFSFSAEELMSALTLSRTEALSPGQMSLVVSGLYHNTILALAVACGLPVTLLFVTGGCLVVAAFWRRFRVLEDTSGRMFFATLFAYFIGILGQALMNGGGDTFLALSAIFGIMNGMLARPPGEPSPPEQPA